MRLEAPLECNAIELLGVSPPSATSQPPTPLPDVPLISIEVPPDEACKEGQEEGSSSSDEREGHNHTRKRKKKQVTFAEFTNEPQGIMDECDQGDEDEDTLEHPSPLVHMRYKRSASLPHIELNEKLNKKLRKILDKEDEEDSLNHLLDGTLKFFKDQEPDQSSSEMCYEYEFNGGQLLQVRKGDITEECVDIIVNEANSNLQHSRGIAGAIAQKGGRDIQHQSDRWIRKYGPVPPGAVAATEAGALHAKRILHAVGPIWRGGNSNEDNEYWDAIWHALEWAHKYRFKSIAIPPLGVGFLGFPVQRSAYLLVDCIAKFFMQHPKSKLREIRLVSYDQEVADAMKFEMVGKFTAGCETSESDRSDLSGSEMDDEMEDEDTYEEDEPPAPSQMPFQPLPFGNKDNEGRMQLSLLPKERLAAFNRRQSIAGMMT